MDEDLIGAIKLVAFNYAPVNYMICDGRILNVNEHQALYALLGNNFGGDSNRTFALPKINAPMENLHYIICVNGIWPSRD